MAEAPAEIPRVADNIVNQNIKQLLHKLTSPKVSYAVVQGTHQKAKGTPLAAFDINRAGLQLFLSVKTTDDARDKLVTILSPFLRVSSKPTQGSGRTGGYEHILILQDKPKSERDAVDSGEYTLANTKIMEILNSRSSMQDTLRDLNVEVDEAAVEEGELDPEEVPEDIDRPETVAGTRRTGDTGLTYLSTRARAPTLQSEDELRAAIETNPEIIEELEKQLNKLAVMTEEQGGFSPEKVREIRNEIDKIKYKRDPMRESNFVLKRQTTFPSGTTKRKYRRVVG